MVYLDYACLKGREGYTLDTYFELEFWQMEKIDTTTPNQVVFLLSPHFVIRDGR